MNLTEQAKADAFADMMMDEEMFDSDADIIERDGVIVEVTRKPPTTRHTKYPTDATRGTGRAPSKNTPTPLRPGDKFATVYAMKEYIHDALQPEPRRVIGRYKTAEAAIKDAKKINAMKDTQAIVIEYDGESDIIPRGYRDTHTVWREEKI